MDTKLRSMIDNDSGTPLKPLEQQNPGGSIMCPIHVPQDSWGRFNSVLLPVVAKCKQLAGFNALSIATAASV